MFEKESSQESLNVNELKERLFSTLGDLHSVRSTITSPENYKRLPRKAKGMYYPAIVDDMDDCAIKTNDLLARDDAIGSELHETLIEAQTLISKGKEIITDFKLETITSDSEESRTAEQPPEKTELEKAKENMAKINQEVLNDANALETIFDSYEIDPKEEKILRAWISQIRTFYDRSPDKQYIDTETKKPLFDSLESINAAIDYARTLQDKIGDLLFDYESKSKVRRRPVNEFSQS